LADTFVIDHVPPLIVPSFPICKLPLTATATCPDVTFVVWSNCFAVPETVIPADPVTVQSFSVGQLPLLHVKSAASRRVPYVDVLNPNNDIGLVEVPTALPDICESGTSVHA